MRAAAAAAAVVEGVGELVRGRGGRQLRRFAAVADEQRVEVRVAGAVVREPVLAVVAEVCHRAFEG